MPASILSVIEVRRSLFVDGFSGIVNSSNNIVIAAEITILA